MQTELQALQNAANGLSLDIIEMYQEDKRKKIKKYIAKIRNAIVSPELAYTQMNHFLLGWRKALQCNK